MTESIDQQVSAFSDDELSLDECIFLVKRLERDPEARGKALRYALVGAALRGELFAPDPDVLRRRLTAVLEGVHVPARSAPAAAGMFRQMMRPAIGVAIAAGVAGIVIIALSTSLESNDRDSVPTIAAQPLLSTDGVETLPSYVVPQSPGTQSSITLTNYLMQHEQVTPAIRRASISSSVVGDQRLWRNTDGTEPTE